MHITKTFSFDAAHRLDRLPLDHKCHRLHGHTYKVEVHVAGPLNELGWIVDYADIAAAWAPIEQQLDHRYLNEVPGLELPTTEILAMWIYDRLKLHPLGAPSLHPVRFVRVRVYESSSTYCEVP